jgi:hypothetical protein
LPAGGNLGQVAQQRLPPLREAQLERGKREAVPRGVRRWETVPAEMLDGHPGLAADGLEPDMQFGVLVDVERFLSPTDGQVVRRIPRADRADDKGAAVLVGFHQPTRWPRVERQRARASDRELEQFIGSPPGADLVRECGEGSLGSGIDPQRDQHAGR